MNLTTENILLVGSVLLFVSIFAGKAGSRFGVPAHLLFLGVGMLFGADGFGIEFNNPHAAQFIGLTALSVILFSGGLDTRMGEIRPIAAQGIVLATIGVVTTMLFTGGIIYFLTNYFSLFVTFTLPESMLLASIMSSTDSASVFSILRSKGVSLKNNLRPLLELESGSNDPVAFMLTTSFLKLAMAGEVGMFEFVVALLLQFIVGAILGWAIAQATILLMRRIVLESKSLYHIMLLASLFFTVSFTELLGGNGLLAVYLAGFIIGNSKHIKDEAIYTFFDGMAWLSQLILFLTLGLLVNPSDLITFDIIILGVAISLAMIIIARPLTVFLLLAPFRKMDNRTKTYVSWVGLKGAVPIVFATYPLMKGQANATIMFNVVFFITLISLITQGTTVNVAASLLGLTDNPTEKKRKKRGRVTKKPLTAD